jgi:hypothetical protein
MEAPKRKSVLSGLRNKIKSTFYTEAQLIQLRFFYAFSILTTRFSSTSE